MCDVFISKIIMEIFFVIDMPEEFKEEFFILSFN